MNSGIDPEANFRAIEDAASKAKDEGAEILFTPEMALLLDRDRLRAQATMAAPEYAEFHDRFCFPAEDTKIDIALGSMPVPLEDGMIANRSYYFRKDGEGPGHYDKLHMFDVTISDTETYRESDGYRPGDRAVLANVDDVPVGLTICYDLRFPYLYRGLARAGAKILTVPAAFSPDTGAAHWEPLLRARAIETGSFILAPAQCGSHASTRGRQRSTHGHSLVVDPWGRVLSDGGDMPGVQVVDLNLAEVDDTRRRIPSLTHGREYQKA